MTTPTTPNFSGFLSKFASTTGTSGIYRDILSTFGQAATGQYTSAPPNAGAPGTPSPGTLTNYFYLGPFLIQYSQGTSTNQNAGNNYYQTYAIPFKTGTTPTVIVCGDSNGGVVTIVPGNSTVDYFGFYINNNNSNINWLAIGQPT